MTTPKINGNCLYVHLVATGHERLGKCVLASRRPVDYNGRGNVNHAIGGGYPIDDTEDRRVMIY